MKCSVRSGAIITGLCIGLLIGGCASYYRVTDPESGKVYFTQDVDTISGGAVKLKDARTGGIVTIQNSEVKEISKHEYIEGLTVPAATPATAPAPPPSTEPSGTK